MLIARRCGGGTTSRGSNSDRCVDKRGCGPPRVGQRGPRDKPLGSIDRTKLNVKGGSIAIGHPFAATGARILATMAKLLDEAGGGRGLVSVCTAGGMGVTAIVEK